MMPVISRRQRDSRCYKRIVTVESLSELIATPVPTFLQRSRFRLTPTANALPEPLASSQTYRLSHSSVSLIERLQLFFNQTWRAGLISIGRLYEMS